LGGHLGINISGTPFRITFGCKARHILPHNIDNRLAYAAQKHREWKEGGWQEQGFVGNGESAEFINTHHTQSWLFLRLNKFKIINFIL
jgi:hypothetical protein